MPGQMRDRLARLLDLLDAQCGRGDVNIRPDILREREHAAGRGGDARECKRARTGVRTARAFGTRIPGAGTVLARSLEDAVRGRIVMITGASSGIGNAAAANLRGRACASRPCSIRPASSSTRRCLDMVG